MEIQNGRHSELTEETKMMITHLILDTEVEAGVVIVETPAQQMSWTLADWVTASLVCQVRNNFCQRMLILFCVHEIKSADSERKTKEKI